MITSNSNPQIKNLIQLTKKAKARKDQGLFVVEGKKMFSEIPKDWLQQTYVSESFLAHDGQMELEGISYEVLSDSIFSNVSDTQTPQGILALVRIPKYELSQLLPDDRPAHLLVLESIQDPGNLGTMFRTGEGAGITGIIMNKTTVDLFNPKTVRSTMGSIYRVPYFVTDDLPMTLKELQKSGVRLYAAHLKGTQTYDAMDYRGATGFLIGNEGNGLSDEIADMADSYIRIPMEGKVESLNAAIAATLLMYEVHRQR